MVVPVKKGVMAVAVLDTLAGCRVSLLDYLFLLVGSMNVPFFILFDTACGKRKPKSLVTILPSALLTSDSEQWVDWDFA